MLGIYYLSVISRGVRMNSLLSARLFSAGTGSLLAVFLFAPPGIGMAEYSDAVKECMLQNMEVEGDDTTLGQLRNKCLSEHGEDDVAQSDMDAEGVVKERLAVEDANILSPFTLMAHRPNYLLVAAYNSSGFNAEPFREAFDDPSIDLDDTEAQFQLSVKFPLAVNLFDKNIDIFAAYTIRSFSQAYNSDISFPFRDTNHEPEAWVQFRPDWRFAGFSNSVNALGFVHQSNGRGGDLSRSWNRIYANFLLERGDLALGIKPWYRIPGNADDDNPDIDDFLGYGEVRAAYKWKENTFGMMFRNVFESGFEKGAVELSWSFPLWDYDYFRGYVQYFNGYGQSLIDYNQRVNSIGIGLSLTDYL